MRRTRDWARENSGVFALLPWRSDGKRREEWETYLWDELSACADWDERRGYRQENLNALFTLGEVFDQMAATDGLEGDLEGTFQKILTHIYPTYQAQGEGAGIGWAVPRNSKLFRRVGQLAGRLWEAIGRDAIGTRLQRCQACGLVRYRRRRPRPGDYACSNACQEIRRELRKAGSDLPSYRWRVHQPSRPESGPLSKPWAVTEVSPLPTALAAPVTQRIELPTDATGDDEDEDSPTHRGRSSQSSR